MNKSLFFILLLAVFVADTAFGDTPKVPEYEQEILAHEKKNEILPLPVELVEEADDAPISSEMIAANSVTIEDPAEALPELDESGETTLGRQNEQLNNSKTTILNVNDVDIATLVKTFSKLTGRNYIVDSNVKGKITIHLPTPVTIDEALRIFDTVLLLKGYTTVPVTENLWKVVKSKDAKQTTIPIISESPEKASDMLVTQIVHFKHVQAEDMKQVIQPFVSSEGTVTSYSGTNALILIDSALNIKRLIGLLESLDVPASDQEITIIPILHAEAQSIAEKINEILGEEESARPTTAAQTRARARTSARRAARQNQASEGASVTRRALPIKIIPDERTNSLIVVADPEMTAKVQGLVERLDSSVDLSSGRFYVYRLKHADSEAISEILTNLISGATGDEETSTGGTSGSSISRTSSQNAARGSTRSRLSERLANALRARRQAREASQAGGKVNFEGEVSIISDPATNSLIINATKSDYEKIKEVLDTIDVQRRQVLVEATILEISLSKDEGMGIELQGTAATDSAGVFAQSNFGGLTNILTNPAALSDLTIAAASSGTVTLPGGITIPSQAVLISALSQHQNTNVLSSPTIVATDNEEAEIIVGENVPFVTSTSTDSSNIDNTFNQIERQDVGITLRITPQVSTGDFLVLKIFVEISNVVAGTRNDPNGPTTTIRTTETTVEVKSGQMVVTGGLISDSVTEATRGVPFLQDIPVLGHLFQREDLNRRRNNLLIFITPRIMQNQFEAREVTRIRSEKMEDTIREQNAKPDRQEVLKSGALDNVVERLEPDKFLPTRITPPRMIESDVEKKEIIKENLTELEERREERETEEEEVISITAKPKLPDKPEEATLPEPAKEVKTSLAPAPARDKYIVLRDITGSELPESQLIPYQYTSEEGAVGVVIPASAKGAPQGFFQVGRRYAFTNAGISRSFVVLGVYNETEAAAASHPEFETGAKWYRMSPQELTNLGQKYWQPLS